MNKRSAYLNGGAWMRRPRDREAKGYGQGLRSPCPLAIAAPFKHPHFACSTPFSRLLISILPPDTPVAFPGMSVYRRKRTHRAIRDIARKYRARRRTKDLDQIETDLQPENQARLLAEAVDPDLPGGGNYLCVECSRHFIDEATLAAHKTTKLHKKRVKCLSEPAYTIEEANAAGGLASDSFYAKRQVKLAQAQLKVAKPKGGAKEPKELKEADTLMAYL